MFKSMKTKMKTKKAYIIGVYQSKVNRINSQALMITDQNKDLVERCRQFLEEVFDTFIYQTEVKYPKGSIVKYKHRLVFWNKEFMDYLREETSDNNKVFKFDDKETEMDYIRGWFDSRASVTFSPHYIERLDWKAQYPKIVIHKQSQRLLKSLRMLLRRHSFSAKLNKNRILITKDRDIKKVIERGLLTDKNKLERLTELYTELKKFNGEL